MAKENDFIVALGAILSPVDIRDYKLSKVASAQDFPEEFELQMRGIKNQGSVGSCVAHSIAETIEYHHFIQNDKKDKMSTGFIYGNRRGSLYTGTGMIVRDALKAAMNEGDCTNSEFSQNVEVPKAIELFEASYDKLKESAYPNRISKFYRLNNANEIKSALMTYGPVVFAITWYSDSKVVDGVLISSRETNLACGGHCMVIYGWDRRGCKIQNSWGVGWGDRGNAILPYDYPLGEAWGIVDDITDENKDDFKQPFHTVVGQFFAKIINKIINIFKKKS